MSGITRPQALQSGAAAGAFLLSANGARRGADLERAAVRYRRAMKMPNNQTMLKAVNVTAGEPVRPKLPIGGSQR